MIPVYTSLQLILRVVDVLQVMIWDDHQAKCIGELSFRSQVGSKQHMLAAHRATSQYLQRQQW
mgnify:CR=1 FL=1